MSTADKNTMENNNLLSLHISPSSGTPIYRQLMEQIQRLVASQRLSEGTLLPSVRTLSEQLEINPMTVSKAYSGLELQGVLTRLRGKGMAVAPTRNTELDLSQRLAQLQPSIERLMLEAKQLAISDDELFEHLKKKLDGKFDHNY